ncbi:MAG: hypothetical protein ACLQVI_04270 [Polyangiaceae bacterium]
MRFFGFFRRRNRAWRMGTFLAVAAGAVAVAPRSAQAALTSSEKGQIASYVAEGHVATAERVRALVARPDLTSDESADALQGAVVPLTFTDVRAAYLHEMLYGPSSLPSRSVLAVAITRALTARADAVVGRHEADLDQDVASIAEVARIFAFLDANVANAGQPKGTAHDPNAGIGASGYDDAGRALATIITNHARWLKGDAQIPAAAEPVRAQLQLALFDMANDTTTRRFDVADRLGLTGSRRAALTELGFLVLDDGHADVRRIDRIRALFARMPGARDGLEAVALMGPSPLAPLRARGEIVTLAAPGPAASASLFGDDIAPPPVDPELAATARALGRIAVERALDSRPDLRAQAEGDAAAAHADPARVLGVPQDASAQSALAAAVQLLTIDAQTTVDLALVGLLAGRPERCAILSDALGALASFAPGNPPSLLLGRARDPSGTTTMANIRVASTGFVTGFNLAGHSFSLTRESSGGISATRDGAPVTLAMLEGARAPVSSGEVWSGGGLVFAKMAGSPRAGVSPGGRVRVLAGGAGAHGVDAIATAAPADDAAVDANVELSGESAIVLRAIATPAGFKGIALILDASSSPARASIRAWDDAGKLTELAPPTDLASAASYAVHVAAKGAKLEARIGATTLQADIPAALAHGDVALAVRHGGSIEARGWTVKRP